MGANKASSICSEGCVDGERHRLEVEWTLQAIAGAIVAGKLPPDDAFAWARIAAYEAEALDAVTSAKKITSERGPA